MPPLKSAFISNCLLDTSARKVNKHIKPNTSEINFSYSLKIYSCDYFYSFQKWQLLLPVLYAINLKAFFDFSLSSYTHLICQQMLLTLPI